MFQRRGWRHSWGVRDVQVNLAAERATLTVDPDRVGVPELVRAIRDLGYEAVDGRAAGLVAMVAYMLSVRKFFVRRPSP